MIAELYFLQSTGIVAPDAVAVQRQSDAQALQHLQSLGLEQYKVSNGVQSASTHVSTCVPVEVLKIGERSVLARSGIEPGDTILEALQEESRCVALDNARSDEMTISYDSVFLLRVRRDDRIFYVVIDGR